MVHLRALLFGAGYVVLAALLSLLGWAALVPLDPVLDGALARSGVLVFALVVGEELARGGIVLAARTRKAPFWIVASVPVVLFETVLAITQMSGVGWWAWLLLAARASIHVSAFTLVGVAGWEPTRLVAAVALACLFHGANNAIGLWGEAQGWQPVHVSLYVLNAFVFALVVATRIRTSRVKSG